MQTNNQGRSATTFTMKLSQNAQDYLKAILLLSDRGVAQTNELAQRLSVTPASVTGMLKKLASMHLVKYERHHGSSLTPSGRKVALEILRHHRLLELYLAEALGYGWDEVHAEAEKLEHHISEEFEDRIAKVLGNPQYDPHGDPIPSKDGIVPPAHSHPLSAVGPNTTVVIKRVSDDQTPLLKHLRELRVGLNTRVTVVEHNEATNTITMRKGTKLFSLSVEECMRVFVE